MKYNKETFMKYFYENYYEGSSRYNFKDDKLYTFEFRIPRFLSNYGDGICLEYKNVKIKISKTGLTAIHLVRKVSSVADGVERLHSRTSIETDRLRTLLGRYILDMRGKSVFKIGTINANDSKNYFHISSADIKAVGFELDEEERPIYHNRIINFVDLGTQGFLSNAVRWIKMLNEGFELEDYNYLQRPINTNVHIVRDINGNEVGYLDITGMEGRFPKCPMSGMTINRPVSHRYCGSTAVLIDDSLDIWCAKSYKNEHRLYWCSACGVIHKGTQKRSIFVYMSFRNGDFRDEIQMCAEKAQTQSIICEHCGVRYSTQISSAECPRCAGSQWRINSYDYTPLLKFHNVDGTDLGNNLHLGIELEFDGGGESQSNCASMLRAFTKRKINLAYAMHDGSLNNGFEIATHPSTLKAHMTKFDYEELCRVGKGLDYGADNTNSCGIHVHMSRKFFGETSAERMFNASKMALLLERHWEDVVLFTRRNYSALENWADKQDLKEDCENADELRAEFENKYRRAGKYVALNTRHSATFELRIFKGSIEPKTIKAILQFCDNLARLVKESSLKKIQTLDFKDIVCYNKYEELSQYWLDIKGEI